MLHGVNTFPVGSTRPGCMTQSRQNLPDEKQPFWLWVGGQGKRCRAGRGQWQQWLLSRAWWKLTSTNSSSTKAQWAEAELHAQLSYRRQEVGFLASWALNTTAVFHLEWKRPLTPEGCNSGLHPNPWRIKRRVTFPHALQVTSKLASATHSGPHP